MTTKNPGRRRRPDPAPELSAAAIRVLLRLLADRLREPQPLRGRPRSEVERSLRIAGKADPFQ